MKITLISPYPDIWAFGVRILSRCLKQNGHSVQFLFLPKDFSERYEKNILDEVAELSKGANLIGISLMTNYFDNVVQITQRLKESSNIPILWGGIHPTIRPEECLNYADMVCIGEGEESLVELANKMDSNQYYYDVRGIWFNDKEKIIKNQLRPFIKDLDLIPFQDYDYENQYILNGGCLCKMDGNLSEIYMPKIYFGGPTYLAMPTRGCPFSCTYCCNNTINKMYPQQRPLIRKRSVDNIIGELVEVKNKLPFIGSILFDDDSFFSYPLDDIKNFSEKYKENIGLPLRIGGATPLTLSREKLSHLVNAGLNFLRMGIQTGSERTRRLYNRFYTNKQVEEATKIINEFKNKIMPDYDIILDNPWETEEDLTETLMLLAKLPTPYRLVLFSLNFYPETELYRKAKMDGIISDDLEDVYRKHYYECKKTYLNGLFFLLNEYSSRGWRMSPKMMFLLTNKKWRQLKLSWIVYIILKIRVIPFKVVVRFKYLLREVLKDIQKGDLSRIIRYTKKNF